MAAVNLVFSIVLLAIITGWLQSNSTKHNLFWLVVGASTLLYSAVPQFGFMVMGEAAYPGHTKGFEITILDIAIASYLISKRGTSNGIVTPFRKAMILYCTAAILTVFFATYYRASLYYVFQLFRMYAVYRAILIATLDDANLMSFLKGLAIGVSGELLIVIYQRFGLGLIQPSGTFGHQNQLGLISNLLLMTFASVFFAGDRTPSRMIAVGATLIMSALTGSRATTALAFSGLAACYLQSLYHGASSRKIKLGVAGAIAATILIPIAVLQLEQRFEREAEAGLNASGEDGSLNERLQYIKAASAMLGDHPFGVGANNFVLVANIQGYYDRANVIPTPGSRSGHVHNIYWLTLGELGYFGFFGLISVMGVPIISGLRAASKYRSTRNGEIAGGLVVALAIAYAHSYYEWLIVTAYAQYFVAIALGLLASRVLVLGRGLDQSESVDLQLKKPVAATFRPHVAPVPGMAKSVFK